jgi:RNA binding exosome subunit
MARSPSGKSDEGLWITKRTKGHESRERVSRFSQLFASFAVQTAFDEQHRIVEHRDGIQAEVAELERPAWRC